MLPANTRECPSGEMALRLSQVVGDPAWVPNSRPPSTAARNNPQPVSSRETSPLTPSDSGDAMKYSVRPHPETAHAAGMQPGPKRVAAAQARIDAIADTYRSVYPSAVKCLLTDREQLTSYLRFPLEHHRRIRHSNFIERTFGETRRRVKVIGRLPGEASCLNLVWAVLDRASRGWRGMTMTPTCTRLLNDLRRQLLDPPTPIHRHDTTKTTEQETVICTAPGTQPVCDRLAATGAKTPRRCTADVAHRISSVRGGS
jgi:Transposase, Mutator family